MSRAKFPEKEKVSVGPMEKKSAISMFRRRNVSTRPEG